MYPLIVLDASGRVRKFYSDLQEHRGIVHKLKSAPKSYRNLTVNVWQRGGGKGSWASNAQYLLRGIVEAIKTKPDEEWLVVAHREDQKRKIPNLEAELRRHFPGSEGRIHVITWGHHRAVNTYAHVSNIILAGTLFLRPGYYEANKHLATGVKVSEREFDKPERKVFEVGEHASDILQALCRGAVRRSQGDACAPCEAWVIASVRSGIPAALPRIFPDCTVEAWAPLEIRLNPTCQKAWGFVASWLETAKRGDTLRFADIQKACGLDRKNFPRDVRNNPGFQQKLAQAGLIEDGNKRFTHYKLT
jgi:hypothetical protein